MKKTLAFIVLLFCSVFVFSQEVYKPGLVVGNSGDTLKGWIKYGNWKINPTKIEFKTDSNGRSATQYTVDDLQYFEITDRDAYKKATVTKDMRSVDLVEISPETTDSPETGTYFLRVLVNGKKFSLYEYLDFKNHYFLQAGNDTIVELLYKLYMKKGTDNIVREWDRYKEQLKEYAGDKNPPALNREIEDAGYTEIKLAKIVIDMNGKDQMAIYGEANKKNRIKPQFFASAGAGITTFNVTGSSSSQEIGLNYQTTVNPALSIGMDLLSPRNFSDFTFRIELAGSLESYKGKIDNYDYAYLGHSASETYTIKQQNITPSLSLLYNIRRTKKVKFYGGLGLAYNFSSYSMNRYVLSDKVDPTNDETVDDPLDLEKVWAMVFLRAGVRLDRKFEIGLTGDLTGSFVNYINVGAKPKTYTLKFVYFFL